MSSESEKKERARKYAAEGRYAEAATLCQQLSAESSDRHGPAHKITLQFRDHAAQCLGQVKEYAAAIVVDEETLRLRREKAKPPDPDICTTLYRLAMNYRELKQFERAVNANQEARGIREALGTAKGLPDLLDIQYELAYDLNKLQKYNQAVTLNRRTLRSLLKTLPKGDEKVMSCRESLAIDLYSLGGSINLQRAIRLFKENLSIAQGLGKETADEILWRKDWCDVCQSRLDHLLKTKEQTPQDQGPIPRSQDSFVQKFGGDSSKQVQTPTVQAGRDTLNPSNGKQSRRDQRGLQNLWGSSSEVSPTTIPHDSRNSRDTTKQIEKAPIVVQVAPSGGTKDGSTLTSTKVPSSDWGKDREPADKTIDALKLTKQSEKKKKQEPRSRSKDSQNPSLSPSTESKPEKDEVRERIEKAYRHVKPIPNLRSEEDQVQEVQETRIGGRVRHGIRSRSQERNKTPTLQSPKDKPSINVVVHNGLKPGSTPEIKRPRSEQGAYQQDKESGNKSPASYAKRRSLDVNATRKDSPDPSSQKEYTDPSKLQTLVPHKVKARSNQELRNTSSDAQKDVGQIDIETSPKDRKSRNRSQSNNESAKLDHKNTADRDFGSGKNQKTVQAADMADKKSTTPLPKSDIGEGVSTVNVVSAKPPRSVSVPTRSQLGKYNKKIASLFDNSKPGDQNKIGATEADAWFDRLQNQSHEVFDQEKSHSGVKIAILDTGFDGSHPCFQTARWRIQGYKSWVTPIAAWASSRGKGGISSKVLKDKCVDDNGHGTHAAALLLKVDPWAQLYVARIAEEDGENGSKINVEHVTEAIAHAIDEWKVDIITMSFGWPTRPKSYHRIEEVIDRAIQHKILVFAAASNTGANSAAGPAFPASLERVFCINSANGVGRRSDFNPTDPGGWNIFTAPGEAVDSAWPLHQNKGLYKRDSGTSIATPIAAATAALVLDFAKQQLPSAEWETAVNFLKEFSGMCYAFMLMANDKDDKGFRYIRPFVLFDASRGSHASGFVTSTMMNMLRGHYPFED